MTWDEQLAQCCMVCRLGNAIIFFLPSHNVISNNLTCITENDSHPPLPALPFVFISHSSSSCSFSYSSFYSSFSKSSFYSSAPPSSPPSADLLPTPPSSIFLLPLLLSFLPQSSPPNLESNHSSTGYAQNPTKIDNLIVKRRQK